MRFASKHRGLSLAELLVALLINVIIIGSLVSVFAGNISSSNKRHDLDVMNNQMQAIMDMMMVEIQRAGYWADSESDLGTGQNNNPFMQSGTDISVNGAQNCIIFSYDHNKNGTMPGVSSSYDDERYGYRLINQAIQARPHGAVFSCTAADNAWENITDPNVFKVTALTFTLATQNIPDGQASNVTQARTVSISMTGQLTSDTSVVKTITGSVRVYNDKYIP